MRALLVLFMVESVDSRRTRIHRPDRDGNLRTLHGLRLPGHPAGWLDRGPAARCTKTILYGGIIIMCGHFILAVPSCIRVLRRTRIRGARHGPVETKHQCRRRRAVRAR